MNAGVFDERACRLCGCTDAEACELGCWWIEEDLCSACPQPGTDTGTVAVRVITGALWALATLATLAAGGHGYAAHLVADVAPLRAANLGETGFALAVAAFLLSLAALAAGIHPDERTDQTPPPTDEQAGA